MQSSGGILRVIVTIFAVLFVGMGSFGAGVALERYVIGPNGDTDDGNLTISSIENDTGESADVTFELVEEVVHLLDEEYYYEDFQQKDLVYNALEGMVGGLSDQYTVFMRPTETRISREQLSGQYEGIGVWVEQPEGRLTVVAPMRGSPAEKAGLQSGDVILTVDGVAVEDMTMEEAVRRVKGPEGTSVKLTIKRPGESETLEFTIERAQIEVPAVMFEMRDDIALLTVTIMGDNTIEELENALTQAEEAGAEGIVLDLRNNGGGWVSAAQEMIGRFVPVDEGPALYERRDPDSEDPASLPILTGDVTEYSLPMAVLVNGSTASAAEIVAGALQDYERATIIGTQTLGKGSIQRIHTFDDGSSVRITIAEWLTPEQRTIQDQGIPPDITVELPEDQNLGGENDPQLQRALEELREAE